MIDTFTDEDLNPIKEYMVKNATSDLEKNEAWSGAIAGSTLNGVDAFNGRADIVNSITTQDVKDYMRALLDQNNYRVIVLDPESK